MEKQEKLDILVNGFTKLEESRKDYIRDLTKKLAEIHCGVEFRHGFSGNGTSFSKYTLR